jgi:hypothetical protein
MILNPATTKLKYAVKDDLIDIDHLMDYHLSLLIAKNELSISVVNSKNNRCLLGEKHTFSEGNNIQAVIHACDQIFEDHHLLKAGFWSQITVAITNNSFTLVPNSLFDKANKSKYLELHNDIDENTVIYSHQHKSFGATSVFSVNQELVNWFKEMYPSKEVKYIHQTSAFIEGVLHNKKPTTTKSIYLNCEGSTLTIAVLNNGQLDYCNNFQYSTPQDIVYYTLFVMNELYLSTESTPMTIWGDINLKSTTFLNLYKFIRYIDLGEKPKTLTYGYVFDDIEENALFNAHNIYHCE